MLRPNGNNNKLIRLLGFSSYGIGIAAGFFLILVATWADMESSAYDFPRLANAGLRGLHCPILMTPAETSMISLDISNPTENRISPAIKTLLSTRLVPEQLLEGTQLTPGESKRFTWSVDATNIDLGSFIFAKVLLYSAHPLPTRETTCGILVIDVPGTGRVIVPVLVVLSLAGMAWGLHTLQGLRLNPGRLRKYMGSMMFLAILISLGLVLSFLGGWLSSLIVVVVSLLLMIVLLSSLFVDQPR
jgi:hypothetical protein